LGGGPIAKSNGKTELFRRRLQITRLIIFCLLVQALVPLGQILTWPGTGTPVVICSQFGTLIVDAETGEPIREKRDTSRSTEFCVLCQALTASGLLPSVTSYHFPVTQAAAEQPSALEDAASQPMAFRFGIFARPPPARA
jgi:hypothetical protein